jgi:phosphoribosylformylglycinamidine synthase
MLGRLNLCSGETKARHYDHEVKALSVVKPLIGTDNDVPSDASVFLARHGSTRGFVLSEGVNPFYSDIDTRAMAMSVVDEAVRRQLCVGADPERIALLDNFCWPDPVQSETTPDGTYKLAQLVRACRGLYEACRAYGTPLISGKDSMKNESTMGGVKISVPPTLLVSAMGQIDDVRSAVTLEPQQAGDVVFLLGATRDECGGSEYFRYLGERDSVDSALGQPRPYVGLNVPQVDLGETLPLYRTVGQAQREGIVQSATTPAKGGLGPALARSVMASGLGLDLDLGSCPDIADLRPDTALFSESNGRFLVTTRPEDAERLEKLFDGLACRRIGTVDEQARLRVRSGEQTWLDLGVDELKPAFKETLADE